MTKEDILEFIEKMKDEQGSSYEEMLHIVSCKFSITEEYVDLLYQEGKDNLFKY